MRLDQWLVLLTGMMAIGWVCWYFLLARRSSRTAAQHGGIQEVEITVRGGYDPAEVVVRLGQPVRLWFDRQETSGCSEEVVFPSFGIRRFLPPHQRTAIELTPKDPGTHEFTCGMGMLRGRLKVISA